MSAAASPIFTDLYQWTMALSYLENKKAHDSAVFEMFFRECPFEGEYAIMAGHDRIRQVLESFSLTEKEWSYLESLPELQPSKLQALKPHMHLNDVRVFGIAEGEPVFSRTPILQVEGPLFKVQLLESALLNAVNFAILCTTYARRIRQVAPNHKLVEFGLRRAQGPDGAMTATRSAFLGGFDGTSNVLGGMNWGIPVFGTMAHSFVQSFTSFTDDLLDWNGRSIQDLINKHRPSQPTHQGELAAFLAYAKSFPKSSLLLVDTYDAMASGVPNAICTFKILRELGHTPLGIRLDSGDLVYQSKEARRLLDEAGFQSASIFASNDLSERIIASLQAQGSAIGGFGVGTHLVTCKDQPALGAVYKMVEIENEPRIKISEQTAKISIPGAKNVYRLVGKDGRYLLDLMQLASEPPPQPGKAIWAHHPFDPFRKAEVTPSAVIELLTPLFENGAWISKIDLQASKASSAKSLKLLREDILRRENPTPYKVSLSENLKETLEHCLKQEAPRRHLA